MSRQDFRARVVTRREGYEKWIRHEADVFRAQVLVPFCDRHGASFVSGNGAWVLFLNSNTDHGADLKKDAVRAASGIPEAEALPILAALRESIVPYEYEIDCGPLWITDGLGTFGAEVASYDTRKRGETT